MKVIGPAAKTVYYLKKIQGQYPTWTLNYKIKCKSTENELTNLLEYSENKEKPASSYNRKRTVLRDWPKTQKTWVSPKGGIWLSAAYPIFSKEFECQIFNLSLGIKLCEMLRQENINVCLKWPNDIFFGSKKLIGFLPRVITRGKEIIYVRVGLGMNVLNYTPSEGISLSKVLQTKNINQHYWTAKVLKAFYDSIECNKKKEYVIKSANKFLTKSFLPSGYCPHTWKIKDIDSNGNLRIENETQVKVIRRF